MGSNIEKITSIEQQIERLKEKQRLLEQQMQQEIGKEVLKYWNVASEQEAMEWVRKLANQVNGQKDQEPKEEGYGHQYQ